MISHMEGRRVSTGRESSYPTVCAVSGTRRGVGRKNHNPSQPSPEFHSGGQISQRKKRLPDPQSQQRTGDRATVGQS